MAARSPRARRSLSPAARVVISAAVVIAIAVSLIAVHAAQYSGTVRWILGVVFLGGLAIALIYAIARRTHRPAPLVVPAPPREILEGELASLAAIADRAGHGLAFSQGLLVARVREAFTERVRLVHGLSPETMRDAGGNPGALRYLVGDVDLTEFLLGTRDRDARAEWAFAARKAGDFDGALLRVLDRMEAWR